ncbi:hypothetical protein V2O64_24745 (plasmid) [Verrucomicrobiaceae bacterium 227]
MVLLFSLLIATAAADPYVVGSTVKPFKANDQHGRAYTFDSKTRFLLLSEDMKTGKKANAALHKKGKDYFGKKKAAYVANIHGMPGIGRMFAFKKMKEYDHRIIYGDDEGLMKPFPFKEGLVTVLALDSKGKILRISYWSPTQQDVGLHLR